MWFIIQLNRDVVAINILSNLRNTKILNKNDLKQVHVQVPTSADKVALLAFAAQCNLPAAAAWHPATAAVDRYLLPARRSAANPPQKPAVGNDGIDKWMDT